MADLRIPEHSFDALEVFLKLPDSVMNELLKALSEVKLLTLDVGDVVERISPKVKAVSQDQLQKAVRAILSLNATRSHFETPPTEFSDDVLSTLEHSGRKNLSFSTEEHKKAKQRLESVLGIEELSIASKAMHLGQDHERLFSSSRILTDARPVYGSDPAAAPVAVLIGHTLKLSFFQDDESMDFYLALDSDDLTELKKTIERAELKAASLQKLFVAAKVAVVDS